MDDQELLCKLNDLGGLSYYLWVAFQQNRDMMCIHRAAYCRRVLELFGTDMTKSKRISLVANIDRLFGGAVFGEARKESGRRIWSIELLESLRYLRTQKWPAVKFAENVPSRFVESSVQAHRCSTKRVLWYLVETTAHRMMTRDSVAMRNGHEINTEDPLRYNVSDWARCINPRRSRSGHVSLYWNDQIE